MGVSTDNIVAKWDSLADTLSNEKKDALGKAWLIHIVGLSEQEFEGFMQDSLDTRQKVGMIFSGAENEKNDLENFWNEVHKIIPEIHTAEEIDHLINEMDWIGPELFSFRIDHIAAETSDVMRAIGVCAAVNK